VVASQGRGGDEAVLKSNFGIDGGYYLFEVLLLFLFLLDFEESFLLHDTLVVALSAATAFRPACLGFRSVPRLGRGPLVLFAAAPGEEFFGNVRRSCVSLSICTCKGLVFLWVSDAMVSLKAVPSAAVSSRSLAAVSVASSLIAASVNSLICRARLWSSVAWIKRSQGRTQRPSIKGLNEVTRGERSLYLRRRFLQLDRIQWRQQ
jgi:hypothetical protein